MGRRHGEDEGCYISGDLCDVVRGDCFNSDVFTQVIWVVICATRVLNGNESGQ